MAERLITWVVPVADDALQAVERVLSQIASKPACNGALSFDRLPMVHFASLTLFNRDDGAARALVFESNVDAPVAAYVEALAKAGRGALDTLFAGAPGYPGAEGAVVDYLMRTLKKPELFHVGHPDRSVREIRGDRELRRSVEREFEEHPSLKDMAPAKMIAELRRIAGCPGFFRSCVRPWHQDWTKPPVPGAKATRLKDITWEKDSFGVLRYVREIGLWFIAAAIEFAAAILLGHWGLVPIRATLFVMSVIVVGLVSMSAPDVRLLRGIIAAVIIAVVVAKLFEVLHIDPLVSVGRVWLIVASTIAAPTLVIAASYVWIMLRLKVTSPLPPLADTERQRIQQLMEAEDRPDDHSIYNHVAGLSTMKGGYRPLRRIRSWLALSFLNLFYRTYFVRGKLVSIASIHFAQWTLLRDGMLFLTNYDGSADSYLDDFFNSLAKGVAFIWYDMKEFPETTDPRGLKMWVRRGQTVAAVRYRAAAYDGLTVDMINNNLDIRSRLLRGRDARSARRWVRRFATTPVEPTLAWRLAHWVTGGAE